MSFRCESYRVLIASPSDMPEERQAATDAINEWNALHAAAESTVLLPVRWETHAMPETGVRPQDAINRQLVSECDILLGLFWTKLGTVTGVAESGTVEEIDEFVGSNKPAMLYFSSRPIDPTKIDRVQHDRLHQFQDATYAKALFGTFNSLDHLRHVLLRDLTHRSACWSAKRPKPHRNKLDDAFKLTELIRMHRDHRTAPEQFQQVSNSNCIGAAEAIEGEHHRSGAARRGRAEWVSGSVTPPTGRQSWSGYRMRRVRGRNGQCFCGEATRQFLPPITNFGIRCGGIRTKIGSIGLRQGKNPLPTLKNRCWIRPKKAARRIERKHGKTNCWDDFEWGLLSGDYPRCHGLWAPNGRSPSIRNVAVKYGIIGLARCSPRPELALNRSYGAQLTEAQAQ